MRRSSSTASSTRERTPRSPSAAPEPASSPPGAWHRGQPHHVQLARASLAGAHGARPHGREPLPLPEPGREPFGVLGLEPPVGALMLDRNPHGVALLDGSGQRRRAWQVVAGIGKKIKASIKKHERMADEVKGHRQQRIEVGFSAAVHSVQGMQPTSIGAQPHLQAFPQLIKGIGSHRPVRATHSLPKANAPAPPTPLQARRCAARPPRPTGPHRRPSVPLAKIPGHPRCRNASPPQRRARRSAMQVPWQVGSRTFMGPPSQAKKRVPTFCRKTTPQVPASRPCRPPGRLSKMLPKAGQRGPAHPPPIRHDLRGEHHA